MAWDVVKGEGRTFWIDWDTVFHLLYAYRRASILNSNATIVKVSHEDKKLWNPFSWMLPDLFRVRNVDYKKARIQGWYAAIEDIRGYQQQIDAGRVTGVQRRVRELPRKTKRCQRSFQQLLKNAHGQSMRSSQRSENQYMTAVEISRFIRNLSADVIMVGAGLVSGGAAYGLAGLGSVAKGAGTYQDTGHIGAAAIKAVGSFTVALIPIKVPGKSLDNPPVLVLTSGIVDGSTTYAAGGDLREALAAGGAAMIAKTPLFDGALTKGLVDDVPIPVKVVVGQGLLERSAEDRFQAKLEQLLKKNAAVRIPSSHNRLIRQAPDVPQLLARLAILDTDPKKGLLQQVAY